MRRWWWLAVAVVAVLPGFAGAGAQEAPERTGYEQVVELTFPVAGPVTYGNDYHADRGGGTRRHQATDLAGEKLQRIHAAVGGAVLRVTGVDEPVPSYGYQIVIRGDDGREYGYVHLNNDTPGTDDGRGGAEWAYAPGMRRGVRVERGQWIGYLGDSGNAEDTVPHLHFTIHDPNLVDPRLADPPYQQGRINPFWSLEDARRRGDVPAPVGEAPLRRIAGATRVDTAVALSAERAVSTSTVVVVPQGSHAEALLSAPLAAAVDGPVLLTAPDRLSGSVASEVARLGATAAILVGRPDQLSQRVEDDLAQAGVTTITRLAGADVYALSALVAREVMDRTPADADRPRVRVLLALGEHPTPARAWPDALSASALAAHLRAPILLVRTDDLPGPVGELLGEARPGLVTVVGGTAAVSDDVAAAAARAAGDAPVERLGGATRYDTSAAVAQAGAAAGLDGPEIWVATGRNFPDALAAGPAAARVRAPLLLVDGDRPDGSAPSEAWLQANAGRLERAVVIGGTAAVRDDVARGVSRAIALQ